MGRYVELPSLNITDCTGKDSSSVGQSLPLVLATCGYDVWLGNYRGNRYSTGHVLLNPDIGKTLSLCSSIILLFLLRYGVLGVQCGRVQSLRHSRQH